MTAPPRSSVPALPDATLCVLFFGNHFKLCERFFIRLARHTPLQSLELRIGLNAVCAETARFVEDWAQNHPNAKIFASAENIYKPGMMRRMFHELPIRSTWIIWFDDDSYPTRSDWLVGLSMAIRTYPDTVMFGRHFFTQADDPLIAFIESADWYRGVPFQTDTLGQIRIDFIAGGYWALRTDWIYKLNWPDRRLIQNEEDFVFGEALRQNGGHIREFASGVEINAAARRCAPGTKASY